MALAPAALAKDNSETTRIIRDIYRNERSLSGLVQRLRPHIAPFHQLLPLVPASSSVLDVGCGAGLWAGLLVVTGQAAYVHGFDASQKAIDVAKRMRENLPKEQQGRLSFEYRSVTAGLPDPQFDVVSMVDVLHHISPEHQEQAIVNVWEKVKKGGLFIYKDMASKPWYCGVMNRLHDLASVREWIHYYPTRNVESTILVAGGNIENAESCRMFLWYQHEWRVFRKA